MIRSLALRWCLALYMTLVRAPIWMFRAISFVMTAYAFGFIGWLIGGWQVGTLTALAAGAASIPFLIGINNH